MLKRRRQRQKRRPTERCRRRFSATLKPSHRSSESLNAPEQALTVALRFLARRARSEAEITAHLRRKGCSPRLATLILRKIRASRYAGDESFARDWTRSRADARGYGPLRIEQELRARGVDGSLISESLQECFGGGRESERARQALLKRFRREEFNEPEALRRATAFLQRRGYSETVILELLRVHED